MLVVSYGLGMPALGDWAAGLGPAIVVLVFLGFALVYTGLWAWLLPRALKRGPRS